MVKKVSLKDIALRIGVSTALVSYVLSGKEEKGRVGKETAEKIRKAAEELNYQPNHIAKSLKTGKSNTIGLIVADISNPFFASIARGIEDESSYYGLTTIIGSSDESPEKLKKLVDVFLKRQVDGFIISPPDNSQDIIKYILSLGIPLCLIDRHFEGVQSSYVVTDNSKSMYDAVKYLIGMGYTKLALVTYESNLQHMRDREQGFVDAVKDINSIIYRIDYSHQHRDLHHIIKEIVNDTKTEAIVFSTNTLSVAGLKLLTQSGIQIPKDMNVMCFDFSEVYDFFYSPIIHVKQPIELLSKESVTILVNQMQLDQPLQQVVFNSELITDALRHTVQST